MLNWKLIGVPVNKFKFSIKTLFISYVFLGFSFSSLFAESNFESFLKGSKNSSLAFYAEELDAAANIIDQNGDRAFIPASLTKVLTSYYALKNFGKNFAFATEIYLLDENTSHPDLLIRGSGAPDLVIEDLFLIARKLQQLGLRRINNIIIEQPVNYDEPLVGPEAYQAQTSALPINYNSIGIEICPTKLGNAALVTTDLPELPLRNAGQILTVASSKQVKPIQIDLKYQPDNSSWSMSLAGAMQQSISCQTFYRAIPEAREALAPIMQHVLSAQGIESSASKTIPYYSSKLPSPFMVHRSRSMAEIVYRMNRYSSNLISKQLAFLYDSSNKQNSFSTGVLSVQDYFKTNFSAAEALMLFDTSGLDRRNRLSPKLLVQVLRAAAKDSQIDIELQHSLVMPREGTMRNRNFRGINSLRAKTGYINGVSGLSGYLTTSSGRRWVFAIMQNNVVARERALDFEETIIARFYKEF